MKVTDFLLFPFFVLAIIGMGGLLLLSWCYERLLGSRTLFSEEAQ